MTKSISFKKIILILAIALVFLLDKNFYPVFVRADDSVSSLQDKLNTYMDKEKAAQQQLQQSQSKLSQNQYSVNMTKGLINQTQNDIAQKEDEINNLEQGIELNKTMLASYVQETYYDDQEPLANLIATTENMNEFSENFDQMVSVKEKILNTLTDINQAKSDLEGAQADLASKQDDYNDLLNIQQGQQYVIKSNIQQAQATIAQLDAKINQLRSELSDLLGESVSFDDVMKAAKYAAKVTGIRKDYLLGVLVVESDLGHFTGGCTFKQSNMSSSRATIFKNICSDLGYNYQKMKVSCPPHGYKGTGGAMGVAQFMPDTWMAYQSRIADVTGDDPPDPWSLTDGVVAMALKLTQVPGVTDHKESAEAKAYCVYLAGGNWAAYCDNKGTNYGQLVLYWADNYDQLMNNN